MSESVPPSVPSVPESYYEVGSAAQEVNLVVSWESTLHLAD